MTHITCYPSRMAPSQVPVTRTGKLAGIAGGALAMVAGGIAAAVGLLFFRDMLLSSDKPPGFVKLLAVVTGGAGVVAIVIGLVVLVVGYLAIADALRARRGEAAGRLFPLFGLATLVGVTSAISDRELIPLLLAVLAAATTAFNFRAWRHRRREP
jgi:hypothetical protein